MMLRQLHNGAGRLEIKRSRHQPAKQCVLQRAPKRSLLLTVAAAGNGAVQEVSGGLECIIYVCKTYHRQQVAQHAMQPKIG